MANDINKEDPHYKGEYGSIYEVNRKFPTGGATGDFVVIDGWAHYWNADRGTWCVNAERDSYWDELITNIIEKFKLVRGATYMGVASLATVPTKVIGAKMYYFATVAGTYKNFGGLVVPQGINVLYSENGSSWVNTTLLEVAQELGVSTNKVVSQKAVSDKLSDLAEKKFDKENIAQEFGDSEDKVVSQFALPFREIESPEFIKVIVDANDHLLFTINLDGEVDWGKGIPAPIKAKFQEIINQCQQDKTDLLESINTLKGILDKTTIKDEEGIVFETPFRYIQNEEFIFAKVDAEDRLLFGIEWDGSPRFGKTSEVEDRLQEQVTLLAEKVATIMGDEDTTNVIDTMNEFKTFFANIENTKSLTDILSNLDNVAKNLDKTTIKDEEGVVQDSPFRVISNEEFLWAIVDADDRVLFGFYRATGEPYYPLNEMYHVIQNKEYFAVWVTTDGKIVLGLRRDGEIIGEIHAVKALKQLLAKHQGIIESLQKSVLNLRTDVDILKDESKEIPSYYKEYLDNRIKEMDDLFFNYKSYNDSFIFITDLHLSSNHKKSPSLIRYILKYSNINKVFSGGDIPIAYGSKQDLLDMAHLFKKLFYNKISPFGKLYCIEGNHDFTIRTSREENTGYTFPMQFSRNVFCERMTAYPEVFTNEDVADALYYYIDNKGQKIRYIILNTTDSASAGENPWGVLFTFGKTQKDWVAKIVKDTPSNYKLVFMMHVPPITPEKEWYPTTVKFLTAIAEKKEIDINSTHYDFSNAPDVIMCLSGHMHKDECTFKDGLLWVDIACDAFYSDYKGSMFGNPDDYPSKGGGGNINEQTFDCIGIDVNDKKIDMIRIGGGYDRTFHYDVRQVSVGASLQLTSTLRNPIWMICDNVGNTLNSYTWEYSKNNASISEDGIVNGLTEGYSVVCAKDINSKKMEFFGVQIIN